MDRPPQRHWRCTGSLRMFLSHPPIQVHGPRRPKSCPEFSLRPGTAPSLGSNNRGAPKPPTHVCISRPQNSWPLQGTGGPPERTIQTPPRQEQRNNSIPLEVPVDLIRSMDLLFCMLLTESKLSLVSLGADSTTTRHHPTQGYVDHCTKMPIQQKHKKGDSLRPNGTRRRQFSTLMDSTGR